MTKPLRRRVKRGKLTHNLLFSIQHGKDCWGDFLPLTDEKLVQKKLLELYQNHKEEVLSDFISRFPGQRPYFWWIHDAPPGRQMAPGLITKDQRILDIAFLIRHKLLTKAEEIAIKEADAERKRLCNDTK